MGTGKAVLLDGERGLRLEGVLTADELGPYFDELASRLGQTDEFFLDVASGITDASGNLILRATTVPAGKIATIHVVTVEAAGYTPQAAYSSSGAGVNLFRTHGVIGQAGTPITQGYLLDFTPSSTGVLPCLFTYGSDRRWLRAQERLAIQVVAGPANTSITATVQGVLLPSVTP